MVTPSEQRYLYWLTSEGYTGTAPVVEVGTWLGCSTIHLAAGLRDAGFHDALHCFDKFVWGRFYASKGLLDLAPGSSFQTAFEQNVRPVYPKLRVTKTTLQELRWTGGAIELLVLDAPKKLEDLSATLAALGPSLVPGLSLLVLQDYLDAPAYVLAAVLSRLAGSLDLVHILEGSTTVSFKVESPIGCGLAQPIDWNTRRWSPDETRETWRRIVQPLPPAARDMFRPALAMMLFDQDHFEDALTAATATEGASDALDCWRPYAAIHHVYERYAPLFHAVGIHPSRSVWETLRSLKRRARRGLKRRIRTALAHR